MVRLASDGATSAAQRLVHWSPPRPPADDQDGSGADLSASEDQRAASAAQDPSVSASASDHRGAEPCVVCRRDLHPVRRGFPYLVAIMDWASRKVLAWQLSNTMEADFCGAALEEAIARYGKPDIFNTDQGSQFTSLAFTNTLREAGIRISMDGRGRWTDNVFIERLWRSLEYECVFLNAFATGSEARTGIGRWIAYYNTSRPHATFGGRTPDEVYARQVTEEKLAAESNPESTLALPPNCPVNRDHLALSPDMRSVCFHSTGRYVRSSICNPALVAFSLKYYSQITQAKTRWNLTPENECAA